MRTYDCIVAGGGPAGLSAAIYLARALRSVLVVDKKAGRSSFAQINENYLGFPDGIPVRELRRLGREQAERFGAEFAEDEISVAQKTDNGFLLRGNETEYAGRTLILATGVYDLWPEFPNCDCREYVGRSLFWCITCDGYKVKNKSVLIVGRDDHAAATALQFLNFTDKVTFLTNCDDDSCELSAESRRNLQNADIPIHESTLQKIEGEDGMMQSIELENGQKLEVDFMFSLQGAVPNTHLAEQLGVRLNFEKFIEIGDEQRTNVSGVYAAGDATAHFSHQIATAVHEGSMAAQAVNYDLMRPEQKLE